jgi:type I restriction enzyme R subunit
MDKDLRMHGLIQALSRTNRILNSQKSHGEIVCYRDLRSQVDEALRLFGQEQAGQIVLLPGYDECRRAVVEAIDDVQKLGLPEEILDFKHERDKKAFVKLWTCYLRALNTINTFGSYEAELVGEAKLADRDIQDYSSVYHDLYEQFQEDGTFGGEDEVGDPDDDSVVFDITLLKTIEVNIDYILDLIGELVNASGDEGERLRIREDIERHIGASATLREKRKLINDFIDRVAGQDGIVESIYQEFQSFARSRGQEGLHHVAQQYGLDIDKTTGFLNSCLSQREFLVSGQNVTGLKAASKKISFGAARDAWKFEVEQELEQIHNELVSIVETVA